MHLCPTPCSGCEQTARQRAAASTGAQPQLTALAPAPAPRARPAPAAPQEVGYDCVQWTPAIYDDLLRWGDGTGQGLIKAWFSRMGWPMMMSSKDRPAFVEKVWPAAAGCGLSSPCSCCSNCCCSRLCCSCCCLLLPSFASHPGCAAVPLGGREGYRGGRPPPTQPFSFRLFAGPSPQVYEGKQKHLRSMVAAGEIPLRAGARPRSSPLLQACAVLTPLLSRAAFNLHSANLITRGLMLWK